MPIFTSMDDTPMFRKRLHQLEEGAEVLRDRSHKLVKGSKKYMDSLVDTASAELAFAKAIENFGQAGGLEDPISTAVGGPVMSKFVDAMRELKGYTDVLKIQVEHMLVDRVAKFKDSELHNLRDVRRKLERSSHQYDQARDKHLGLKKDAKREVLVEAESELQVAKINYEQARFAFASAVCSIEGRKKYEYVESVACTFDAHLRYFKQGHEMLQRLEPYIQQVLSFSQQARDASQREQESFSAQVEEYFQAQHREDEAALRAAEGEGQGPYQAVGGASQKAIEELMAAATLNGKVEVIKQGYLSKRSSSRQRGSWQRRFFILDSRGMLYYHRKPPLLNFKQSLTPLNSPPTPSFSTGSSTASFPTSSSSTVHSLFQSSIQAMGSGVSSVSSLIMRTSNGAAGNGGHPPDSPLSPGSEPMDLAATASASSTSSVAGAGSGGGLPPPAPFSMFSRSLNPRVKEGVVAGMGWKAFGGGGTPGVTRGSWGASRLGASSTGGATGGGSMLQVDSIAEEYPVPQVTETLGHAMSSEVPGELPSDSADPAEGSYLLVSASDSMHSTPKGSPTREGQLVLPGRTGSAEWNEKQQDCQVLNLLTATIKMDAEQPDLRFCFRIVTPSKTFSLQAESAWERKEWVDKITAVILSLLNSQLLGKIPGPMPASDGDSATEDGEGGGGGGDSKPLGMLQGVLGNEACADCGKPCPDWASLNLGVLMCIECSGIHRNLGVQVSKVRSLTLDVRIWESPPVIAYFQATGNTFANSMWEQNLSPKASLGNVGIDNGVDQQPQFTSKPGPEDSLQDKEKFIQLKYLERKFLARPPEVSRKDLNAGLWKAVGEGDIQGAVRLLVCCAADPNSRQLGQGQWQGQDRTAKEQEPGQDSSSMKKEQESDEGFSAADSAALAHVPKSSSNEALMDLQSQGALNMAAGPNRGQREKPVDAMMEPQISGSDNDSWGQLVGESDSAEARAKGKFGTGLVRKFIRTPSDSSGVPRPRVKGKPTLAMFGTPSKSQERPNGTPATADWNRVGATTAGESRVPAAPRDRGWSLLHVACSQGDHGCVEMLLQHGAQVDAQDSEGRTPLVYALLNGNMALVRHLVARGADPRLRDDEGCTPLERARRAGKAVDESLLVMLS